MLYLCQNLSSLPSKDFTDGASITFCGNSFQKLVDLSVDKFLLNDFPNFYFTSSFVFPLVCLLSWSTKFNGISAFSICFMKDVVTEIYICAK